MFFFLTGEERDKISLGEASNGFAKEASGKFSMGRQVIGFQVEGKQLVCKGEASKVIS